MKKVLIISYYWPPSGGSGVQRWLHMSKYFPEYDWQPVVYTADGAEYPDYDESLLKDIHKDIIELKQPIKEPYRLYKKFIKQKKGNIKSGFINDNKSTFFQRLKIALSIWVRGNFFIPDARCMWIKPSVKYLLSFLKDNSVSAIISTGPPHSMHIIALELHKQTGIPWVADFRDPWTEIDFYSDLKLSKWADKKHHKMELEVLQQATRVVTVSNTWAKQLEKNSKRQVDLVENAYDKLNLPEEDDKTDDFIISHIGILTPARNPEKLWKAIQLATEENKDFKSKLKLNLIGHVDVSVLESLKEFNLKSHTRYIGYLPHKEALKAQRKSNLLLLIVNQSERAKGLVTGKIYEYLASGRKTLAIGPQDGEVAKLLDKTSAGTTIAYDDIEGMKEYILTAFSCRDDDTNININNISAFSRQAMACKYIKLLNEINREL